MKKTFWLNHTNHKISEWKKIMTMGWKNKCPSHHIHKIPKIHGYMKCPFISRTIGEQQDKVSIILFYCNFLIRLAISPPFAKRTLLDCRWIVLPLAELIVRLVRLLRPNKFSMTCLDGPVIFQKFCGWSTFTVRTSRTFLKWQHTIGFYLQWTSNWKHQLVAKESKPNRLPRWERFWTSYIDETKVEVHRSQARKLETMLYLATPHMKSALWCRRLANN